MEGAFPLQADLAQREWERLSGVMDGAVSWPVQGAWSRVGTRRVHRPWTAYRRSCHEAVARLRDLAPLRATIRGNFAIHA